MAYVPGRAFKFRMRNLENHANHYFPSAKEKGQEKGK